LYALLRYDCLVRVKTSITLPEDLLQEIDGVDSNRSGFIERAARQYLAAMKRARRQARDAAILDAHAKQLNEEALDVLEYQGLP
jgi:metal-responsive CopG/Arc/MetJ family transcriptional regulator